tara:strand:+ start:5425 stop:6603 length:1179 start_codon:yes stop_codon:yes gene_type:complete
MRLKDKLKGALQSSKVKVSKKTSSKIQNALTNRSSFKTPESKSEIKRFGNDVSKNLLNTPGEIGRGGSSIKGYLNDQFDNSIENILDNSKGQILKETSANKVLNKVKNEVKSKIENIFSKNKGNVGRNPMNSKKRSQYENKPESFSSFVVSKGSAKIPYIKFEIAGTKSTDSVDFLNSDGGETVKETKKGPIKEVKLPVSPEFLKTSYEFQYDTDTEASFDAQLQKAAAGVAEASRMGIASAAKLLGAGTKVASNPNLENVFKSINFRELQFSFELIPKNETQSLEIEKIVHMFKYWASPEEMNVSKFKFLKYPELWKISYNDGSGGTSGVSFTTKPCYCKSVSIEYGSAEGYLLFKTSNKPTSVRINLSFTENEYITRNTIGDDYTNGGKF